MAEYYIGQIFISTYPEDAAEWCNNNNATIVDQGEYYEVVEIPGPTLEEAKTAKIEYLKSTRNTKELEPILYNGVLFDADKDSLDRLNYAIITLTATHTESIEWTTAENTDVPMTVNDLNLVIASVGNRSNQLHIIYRDLKEQVNACTTVEEVEAITWPED
jgi:hypothetical protein